eukprot:SAG31_NODE_1319_length_8817_cov_1.857077_11_plen_49_part_00
MQIGFSPTVTALTVRSVSLLNLVQTHRRGEQEFQVRKILRMTQLGQLY